MRLTALAPKTEARVGLGNLKKKLKKSLHLKILCNVYWHNLSYPIILESTFQYLLKPNNIFQFFKVIKKNFCLFNLYAKYIMRNAGLEEAQAGIKIDGRNISNLRYADDTTLVP